MRYPDPFMKTAADGNPAPPVSLKRRTFSLVGRPTLDLDRTCDFYQRILGFEPVSSETIETEGVRARHIVFDMGRNQLIAFIESDQFPEVPAEYDRESDVPISFYHFAFEAESPSVLIDKRDQLRANGINVTDIVDHQWSKSIYFKDPDGMSLEYCCAARSCAEYEAAMP